MKTVIIVISTLLLIISFYIWSQFIFNNHAQALVKSVEKLEADIKKEDWESASLSLEELYESLNSKKKIWLLFIDHQEVDIIERSYSKAYKQIELKMKKDSLTELFVLKQAISKIPGKAKLSLENIL